MTLADFLTVLVRTRPMIAVVRVVEIGVVVEGWISENFGEVVGSVRLKLPLLAWLSNIPRDEDNSWPLGLRSTLPSQYRHVYGVLRGVSWVGPWKLRTLFIGVPSSGHLHQSPTYYCSTSNHHHIRITRNLARTKSRRFVCSWYNVWQENVSSRISLRTSDPAFSLSLCQSGSPAELHSHYICNVLSIQVLQWLMSRWGIDQDGQFRGGLELVEPLRFQFS